MDEDIPKVTKVDMLPNFFLRVEYKNGKVCYARSKLNEDEQKVFEQDHRLFGVGVTPAFLWIGSEIELLDDNQFLVNKQKYDGNKIFKDDIKIY